MIRRNLSGSEIWPVAASAFLLLLGTSVPAAGQTEPTGAMAASGGVTGHLYMRTNETQNRPTRRSPVMALSAL